MGLWRSIRVKWRSFRLSRKLRKNPDPLREFIYLDDVSIYSLLASKSGAIPTDFTDKVTRTYTGELTGTGESSSPTGKLGGAFKAGVSHASEQQVARKAIVQSTFRDLRNGLKHEILFASSAKKSSPPSTEEQLLGLLESAVLDGLARRASDLERGMLVELTVELEAHDLFRAGSVIDVMGELLDDLPAGLRPNMPGLANAIAMGKLLDKLLAGLVPLRCRIVDFQLVAVNGTDWIVHQDLLAQLPTSIARQTLHVVGVTEQHLYWRDLRRVVFSQLPVRIMARISLPGVRDSWSPIKLSDVVSRFSPDFATSMAALEGQMRNTGTQSTGVTGRQDRFEAMLIEHATVYSSRIGVAFTPVEAAVRGCARQYRSAESADFDIQTSAFEQIEAHVSAALQSAAAANLDRQHLVEMRRRSLNNFTQTETAARRSLPQPQQDDHLIDCEFVAIYW